jgi:rare lipoprotein A (peptidoglycan hydrolase)
MVGIIDSNGYFTQIASCLVTTTTTSTTSTSTSTTTTAGTAYQITTAAETDMQACNEMDNAQTIYGNNTTWLTVTRFYTDSGMTTPFVGFGSWYNNTAHGGATSYVYEIDSDGYVVGSLDCSSL